MTSPHLQAPPRALALALACVLALPASAQDTVPTVEITGAAPRAGLPRLDTPIETGSRLGLTSRETPASVNVVDRATIELRGAQDTQEILRALPGVAAHNAPGNIGVFYRGFGSGSVSQLFNGINVQYSIAARPVDPAELRVGDVISFQQFSGREVVITHRIVAVQVDSAGERTFTTLGDRNAVVDPPVRSVQVLGRVWYAVPWVGEITRWRQHGPVAVAFPLLSGVLLLYGLWSLVIGWRSHRCPASDEQDVPPSSGPGSSP